MAKVCEVQGCPHVTQGRLPRCEEHEREKQERKRARSQGSKRKYSGTQRQYDQSRGNRHQRGYTSKWAKASATYLKHHPKCVRCDAPSQHVDHVVPHRGDWGLFWDKSNWQALCQPCHNRKTREDERGV